MHSHMLKCSLLASRTHTHTQMENGNVYLWLPNTEFSTRTHIHRVKELRPILYGKQQQQYVQHEWNTPPHTHRHTHTEWTIRIRKPQNVNRHTGRKGTEWTNERTEKSAGIHNYTAGSKAVPNKSFIRLLIHISSAKAISVSFWLLKRVVKQIYREETDSCNRSSYKQGICSIHNNQFSVVVVYNIENPQRRCKLHKKSV